MRGAAMALVLLLASLAPATAQTPGFAPAIPGVALEFPADHGAHPRFRTEWWYVTGWLETASGDPLGFQVTFFRSRSRIGEANPSAFAPRQILFAHAALSDPKVGKLLHGQRIARQGFGLAQAATGDMDVVLDDWRLKRRPDGAISAVVAGEDFALNFIFTPEQALIAQGDRGYSRKGPQAGHASYYYSIPHLEVSGTVRRGGKPVAVTGEAWLDREWSSTLLDPEAVGWDWVGLNLDDGGAVMAFQVRDRAGEALWAGGSYRGPDGRLTVFSPSDVRLDVERRWRSPRTGAVYPVERTLVAKLPSGERRWRLRPLFDDQELDSRASGGPIYWEGAVSTQGGRGYLELTGYAAPMRL